jgi:tetratricopeptide (TPR) repeat protein
LTLFERSGNIVRSVATLCLLAEAARLTGDSDRSSGALRDVLQRSGRTARSRVDLEVLLCMAGHAIDRGDLVAAGDLLVKARACPSQGTDPALPRILELELERAIHSGLFGEALDLAARGLLGARQGGDPQWQMRFLVARGRVLARLGQPGEMRRALVLLADLASRNESSWGEGWTHFLEALVLARESRPDAAVELLARARASFGQQGSQRDFAEVQLEHGLIRLRLGDFEHAYLDFEEGYHTASRLQLQHLRCRFRFAMGKLEAALQDPGPSRAVQILAEAEKTAASCDYRDLVWRIRGELSLLLDRLGSRDEALSRREEARRDVAAALEGIPPSYHHTYLGLHAATRPEAGEAGQESGQEPATGPAQQSPRPVAMDAAGVRA